MEFLSVLIAAGGWAAVPTLASAWIFQRWRSRRRNAAGRCATCGKSWTAVDAGEKFLIHGRLVCEPCAIRARSRLGWQFGLLGGAGLFAATAMMLTNGPMGALFPVVSVAAFTGGAVALMKLANRRARERIIAGSYPFLPRDENPLLDGDVSR